MESAVWDFVGGTLGALVAWLAWGRVVVGDS